MRIIGSGAPGDPWRLASPSLSEALRAFREEIRISTTAPTRTAVEDSVRRICDGLTDAQRLIAYQYLHAQGLRIAGIEAAIARALTADA